MAEVATASQAAKYRLYRVFQFSKGPRLYVQAGSLAENYRLDAIMWRASSRGEVDGNA